MSTIPRSFSLPRTAALTALALLAMLVLSLNGLPDEAAAASPDRAAPAATDAAAVPGAAPAPLSVTDPDLAAVRDRLVQEEIPAQIALDARQRRLIVLVSLTACQTLDGLEAQTAAALDAGVTPVEIKEALYQCAPYIGFPRTEAALVHVNRALAARGIPLPVPSQRTVSDATRHEQGLKVQKSIFGSAIDAMRASAPPRQRPILRDHLSAFCFGDLYTRTGLDLKTRELLTFCIIASLGGCDSQVRSHVQGNAAVGNAKDVLVDALTLCLPYIGFPRTLNALACVNAVLPEPAQNN